MKCVFCGWKFDKDDGRACCRGCPMAGACRMVKCPNCGYEVPVAPEMKRIKGLLSHVFRRTTGAAGS